MSHVIRIGTRDSELALWQAKHVAFQLQNHGYETVLVPVKSTGDLVLDKPLYELGITGVFTKTLDVALLKNEIDIAVHSLKDVPTALPNGIVQAAVLERANPQDVFVHKGDLEFLSAENGIIATGSLRRKAQWLHRYPTHQIVDIRGNVNSRLHKLEINTWSGTIFAAAGLERINLKPENCIDLDWMIPAPAQGIVMCVTHENNAYCFQALQQLNHQPTEVCATIERQFLKKLEGGCTAPIGALATQEGDQIHFKGGLFALDGSEKITIEKGIPLHQLDSIGTQLAQELLQKGGEQLMKKIRLQMSLNLK